MFNLIFKSSVSLSFELNNKDIYYSKEKYDVYLNGEKTLKDVDRNVFSLFNLTPNTKYQVKVNDFTLTVETDAVSAQLNVLDFNAQGDGQTDDTLAIQSAINVAPKNGLIRIPKGTYYVKPLFLKSDITIELAEGATLLGETKRENYPILPGQIIHEDGSILELSSWEGTPAPTFASIITGVEVDNVKIVGRGVVDANAQNGDWWIDAKVQRGGAWRPKGVFLSNSSNVGLHGITVKNTPSWNLHPYFSNNLDFIDLFIESPKDSPNTDGCDPESCDVVNVIGTHFSVGDDCIAIKSGKFEMGMKYQKPTNAMTIRNCLMEHGHGAVVLGSEMSGGVTNLTVTQCYFSHTDRGLRIKTRRGRGKSAVIDGVVFENIYMDEVLAPLVINMYYFCDPDGKTEYVWSKEKLPVDDRTPFLGSFTFKDIKAVNSHSAAGFFYGLPEQPIKSITIENVDIDFSKDAQPFVPAMMSFLDMQVKQGLQFRYVDNVSLKNVNITNVDGEPIHTENVENIEIN